MGGVFKSIFPSSKKEIVYINTNTDTKEQDEDNKKKKANLSGYSNINTSQKGYFDESLSVPNRKTLLGE